MSELKMIHIGCKAQGKDCMLNLAKKIQELSDIPVKDRTFYATLATGYAECCVDSGYIDAEAFSELVVMINDIVNDKGALSSIVMCERGTR